MRQTYRKLIRRAVADEGLRALPRLWRRRRAIRKAVRGHGPVPGPAMGILFVTYRCNHVCGICPTHETDRVVRGAGGTEGDTATLKGYLDGFAAIGTLGVSFTGGEPLLRDDIEELVAHCRRLGMRAHLNTNGFLLDAARARRLVEAELDSVNLSLDAATPETHDRLRGCPGSFDGVLSAVRALREARGTSDAPQIRWVMAVDRGNAAEIDGWIGRAREAGVDGVGLIPAQRFDVNGCIALRRSPDWESGRGIASDLEPLKRDPLCDNTPAYLDLFDRALQGVPSPVPCSAGTHSLTVDCFGRVFRCFPDGLWGVHGIPLGDRDLPVFWRSEEADRQRASARACGSCYWNCHTELNLLFG